MLSTVERAWTPQPARRAEIVLPPHGASARRARRFAQDVLRRVRHEVPTETVLLVVSELVTNAVRHAAGAPVLAIDAERERVRIEVHDRALSKPIPRSAADPDDESGRGLLIVAAVARDWGVSDAPDGKTVWAEIAC